MTSSPERTVRLGIIGMGGMGSAHAKTIEGEVPRSALAAAGDRNPELLKPFGDIPAYESSAELIGSGLVDAVLIATPHYDHTTVGIAALEAGLHVLVEKPISVHKADCERLIAAHTGSSQVFAAMFNQRTDPLYVRLAGLIRSGGLGPIRRIQWTITNWFRTQAYYNSGGWRATWGGEGGGVLLNQCPHQLDLWQWMFGMPARIRAFCGFGRYHQIEVEDDVTAWMEYESGTTGVFITSTGEAPGTNRLEIVADRGRLVVEDGRISFRRNEVPMNEFCATDPGRFSTPPIWNVEIPVSAGPGPQHAGVLRNFADAILDGADLIAPAAEGIHSVELANAMLLSAFEGRTVELPLPAADYEACLQKKIDGSTFVKAAPSVPAKDDFAASFAR